MSDKPSVGRRTIIAGNWKLNPPRGGGVELFRQIEEGLAQRDIPSSVEVLVCPPAPFLGIFEPRGSLSIGAQDVAAESWGAFTGALGGELLASFDVRYALVGHSERRQVYGEADSDSCRKVRAAAEAGLIPLLCVGETESERDAEETFEVLERQLRVGLESLGAGASFVIAYEPVWAIGTGRTATPQQAAEAHRFIRHRLQTLRGAVEAENTAILYGGSVKPENAAALLADNDIDGALIGGASLKADSFLAILDAGVAQRAS